MSIRHMKKLALKKSSAARKSKTLGNTYIFLTVIEILYFVFNMIYIVGLIYIADVKKNTF